MKHNQTSTSNMMRHMRLKHSTIDLNKRRPSNMHVEENNVDDPIVIENQLASTSSDSQTHMATLNVHRPTVHNVQDTITRYLPRPVGASRRTLIDQQVLRMIVKEYYPFSIVEDKEFGKLLKMLNPGYDLPSRKTLSTSLLSVLYNETYDKVKSDIVENGNFVSITTDGWTSVKNESYIAVTTHFIDNDCKLKSYLLSCFMYSESHTSDNLKNELLRVIKEWGLEHRVSACTSDNAPNITKAIDLCKWRHVRCFAHSLNLAVQNAIKEIQEVKEKVSGIVRHFKKSSTAAGKLKSIQEQLGYSPPLVLIQDVVTRWNSTFEMFQRVGT
ncbi:unnamed protein product [Macrosiphum euphorbiae]|uniref:DUF659 domain-containing protein n=1 Tax=Macrosiphum euphorbiae TaxID=13131 RepID=A0AAV0XTU5_9HEMI|nr:unnamed protein product [Macrosiphum euphorbiae]